MKLTFAIYEDVMNPLVLVNQIGFRGLRTLMCGPVDNLKADN
jgi:hypothetical protein